MRDLKKFISFPKIDNNKDCIVVDGLHPGALILSHWKGGNIHSSIEADTSGEIVLNALSRDFPGLDTPNVSANHFDIDGFVGVFSLIHPELAEKYENSLRHMAVIGDFREFNPSNANSKHALKLCCWMNSMERKNFYRPFHEKDEMELCDAKFQYFLKVFPKVLENTSCFENDWITEYEKVQEGINQLEANSEDEQHDQLGLLIRKTTKPIHYYALFSESYGFDIVMSLYHQNRYEVEMKYTTWVDIASRPTLPRIDLRSLAKKLNQIEKSDYIWKVDQITDTGPILRLDNKKLSKADRYDHPFNRDIYSSTISEDNFKQMVLDFLSQSYQGIQPKRFWTWKEMKEVNKAIF